MALPRICVLGTSNSVAAKGGWAGMLQERLGMKIDNYSIGFCSSDLFVFQRKNIDFSRYDLCLLDLSCNDNALFRGTRMTRSHIQGAVTEAVATMTRQGCLPLMVILPLRGAGWHRVRDFYIELCQRYALPYFDGFRFMERLQGEDPAEYDLFKDTMHISVAVSALVAEHLAEAIPRLPRLAEPVAMEVPNHSYDFLPLPGRTEPEPESFRRGTSLISADVALLEGEKDYRLTLPPDWEITSLTADFSIGRGVLSLRGDTALSIRLVGNHDLRQQPWASLVLGIFPLMAPVGSAEGQVTLRVLDQEEADIDATPKSASDPEKPPGLLLAGVTARSRRRRPVTLQRWLAEAFETVPLLEDARFAAWRQRLPPRQPDRVTGKITY